MYELFAIDYLTFFGIISTFTNSIRKQVRNCTVIIFYILTFEFELWLKPQSTNIKKDYLRRHLLNLSSS